MSAMPLPRPKADFREDTSSPNREEEMPATTVARWATFLAIAAIDEALLCRLAPLPCLLLEVCCFF